MIERIRPRNGLVEWAVARERLRLKKAEGGLPPWSDDPILNEYRFCNVRRRDDRVSQWIIEHVINRMEDFDDLWVWLQWSALCRWINWPPTLNNLLIEDCVDTQSVDFEAVGNLIDKRREFGMKAWTGAYIIRAPSKRGGYDGWTKGKFVTEVVVKQGMEKVKPELLDLLERREPMLKDVYDLLCSIPNWGQFMAGQVVADWTYCSLLEKAPDLHKWAPMGPGSRRGYNRMMGLPLKAPPPLENVWCYHLQLWRSKIVTALSWQFGERPQGGVGERNHYLYSLTLHDVQNCLCEYDKYERTRLGEGRPRSRYVQETSY